MRNRWRLWPFTRGGRVAPLSHCEPPVVFGEDWSVAAEAIQSIVDAPHLPVGGVAGVQHQNRTVEQ